jgi:hypothetical protein
MNDKEIIEQYDACLENMLGCSDAAVDAYVKENLCLIREMRAHQRIAEHKQYQDSIKAADARAYKFILFALVFSALGLIIKFAFNLR